jgi:hypothetical protein
MDTPLTLSSGYLEGLSGLLAVSLRLAHPGTPRLLGSHWPFPRLAG